MSVLYNDIIKAMETEFFNECGEYASDYDDVELRFKAVAGEIYAAHTAAEYAMRQAFAQTASGEYLDMHAEMRGITRKTAASALGELTFTLPQELEYDVQIPAGTVCSVSGEPLVQFVTDEGKTIPAGSLSATVPASALAPGAAFNAGAGAVTVMVNPPEYVLSVTNESAFTGGCDEETDEALRERLLRSYSQPTNGANAKSLEEQLLTIDGITDARIAADPEQAMLTVCVRTKSGAFPDGDMLKLIQEKLGILEICGAQYGIALARPALFSVFAAVRASAGADKKQLAADAQGAVRAVCSAAGIGREISLSQLTSAVLAVQGVESAEISASPSAGGTVSCGAHEYLSLSQVQVDVYE